MTDDPFARIGLPATASAADVRAARNRLAKAQHPDVGGDGEAMQELNVAVTAALELISRRGGPTPDAPALEPEWAGPRVDIPSFTVEALPVETFQALLSAAQQLGSVLDDDPPYRLDVELSAGVAAEVGTLLCRLDVVPDAGASTVSLLIAGEAGRLVSIERIRDIWITALNDLDWESVVG